MLIHIQPKAREADIVRVGEHWVGTLSENKGKIASAAGHSPELVKIFLIQWCIDKGKNATTKRILLKAPYNMKEEIHCYKVLFKKYVWKIIIVKEGNLECTCFESLKEKKGYL